MLSSFVWGNFRLKAYWGNAANLSGDLESQINDLRNNIAFLKDRIQEIALFFKISPTPVKSLTPIEYKFSSEKMLSFNLRLQGKTSNSGLGTLLEYLKRSNNSNHFFLKASLGYWGAYADLETGILPSDLLTVSAQNSLYRIQEHIQYLKQIIEDKKWFYQQSLIFQQNLLTQNMKALAIPDRNGLSKPDNDSEFDLNFFKGI